MVVLKYSLRQISAGNIYLRRRRTLGDLVNMDSIKGNNRRLSCLLGATTAWLSVFFILFISGCGKSGTVDKKIDSNEQEISRQIDVQNNARRALVLDVTCGKTPGEVNSVLGAHISEQSLLDFFPGRSTKYY